MRFSGLSGFVAAIALGFSVGYLGLALLGRQAAESMPEMTKDPAGSRASARVRAPASRWPDLFGVFVPDPPDKPAELPEATVINHNFLLKGLFASGADSWAIIADPGGEYLLRPGDELPGGYVVAEITEDGVWLQKDDLRDLVGFPQ